MLRNFRVYVDIFTNFRNDNQRELKSLLLYNSGAHLRDLKLVHRRSIGIISIQHVLSNPRKSHTNSIMLRNSFQHKNPKLWHIYRLSTRLIAVFLNSDTSFGKPKFYCKSQNNPDSLAAHQG